MSFEWSDVVLVWRQFVIYFLLFIIHDVFLAPLIVSRQRRAVYFSVVTIILAVFTLYQCTHRPGIRQHGPHPMEMRGHLPDEPRHPDFDGDMPPGEHSPLHRHGPEGKKHEHTPPAIIGEHDIIAVVVLILMFGMNLGVKFYFKTREDQKKLVELEKENLQQQLEYLKYQINPHFFMNTLNNIHALVDIDPEKAKESIVELSKMMRFILYEGDKHGVPLSREFDFIRNYITLMRLRYTDKVKITVDLPDEAPDKTVPP
ncbi:MAG: histidine kinase, partial [Prevotella sp.]|nr:histidine kinase [Prevotella sp.]